MKKIIFYILIIGLAFFSCKKDGTTVIMPADPIPPSITTLPNLTLLRSNGMTTLKFVGTPVNPGFVASATYFLEAAAAGTNFKDSVLIMSDVQDTALKITVSSLNGALLKKFTADAVSSVDYRIRAQLSIDAGTGAKPKIYTSPAKNASTTIYGLPRLDLLNSGLVQKIESALGDGKYIGFVKLDATKPFTLKNPDTNVTYGATGANLVVNGTALPVAASGWYQLQANTSALTFSNDAYMIGLIGDATPNGWNSPDSKMDYDYQSGAWVITLNLVNGSVKFRKNDGWSSGINLGLGTGYSLDNLFNDGSSSNIPVTAGNYTVRLYIGSTYRCTFTKNN